MVNLLNINRNARFHLHIVQGANSKFQTELKLLKAEGIPVLNVGKTLAEKLFEIRTTDHLEIQVREIVENLVISNACSATGGKKQIALFNFGILLEPDLGLNPGKILAGLSKQITILLLWSGSYQNNGVLSWIPHTDKTCIDISSADPQVIELKNEI